MLFLMIESSAMWVYKRVDVLVTLPSSLKNHATCSAARIAINARQAERLRALGLCSQCRSSICRVRSVSYSLLLVKIQPQNKIITLLRSSEFLDYDLEAVNSQGSKLWRGCLFVYQVPSKLLSTNGTTKWMVCPLIGHGTCRWAANWSGTALELTTAKTMWQLLRTVHKPMDEQCTGKTCKERVGGWWRFVAFEILWRCFVFTKNAGYGGARNERDAPLRSWICRTSKYMNELQETADLMGIFCQCASSPT